VNDVAGTNALLTGAAGGIGRHIARALGDAGVRLAVSGRHGDSLEELCDSLHAHGIAAMPVVADLADPEQTAGLIGRAEEAIGPLDLLVNNAGLETAAAYPAFTDSELALLTQVNLVAPMVLSRHVLPGMLERGRGHIVTVSSLAGRGGNAYNVVYATTKAGLVGFARSLRAELDGTPVGASVICPGFVAHDGMYAEMQQLGLNAPLALRAVEPERVARAVLDAITRDEPDVLITGWPMRPLLAIQEMAPRLAQRITDVTGARDFFARVAERKLRT
jgi:short-subunit dehydrogenase